MGALTASLLEPAGNPPARLGRQWSARAASVPLALGLLAALGLLGLYLGTITLAQGWAHAIGQLTEDRWFVAAIALGYGVQEGLFTYLRRAAARTTATGVATSTGTSTVAMLACCAHHAADVLPILGVSGAAIFLNAYKTPLLWLGIAMNLAGVGYLLKRVLWPGRTSWRLHG